MIWQENIRSVPRPSSLREGLGWLLSASTAVLPLTAALIWVDAQAGHDTGQKAAIMLDLSDLPPVMAVAEPPPAPPLAPPPTPESLAPEPVADPAPPPPPVPEPPLTKATTPEPPAPTPPLVAPPAPPPAGAQADAPAILLPVAATQPPKSRPAKPKPPAAEPAQPAVPAVSGSARAAKPATQTTARQGNARLEAGWGAAIRKKIERRKAYPKAAKGAAGRVTLRMTVEQDGQLAALTLAASSGNAALDEAALAAVRRAGRLPAAPKGLQLAQHVFTLPIDFAP